MKNKLHGDFFLLILVAVCCIIFVWEGCKPTKTKHEKVFGPESALHLLDSARSSILLNPHVTLKLIDTLEKLIPSFQNDSLMLLFYRLQGEYYDRVSDIRASEFYFAEALKMEFPGSECVKADILSSLAERSNEWLTPDRTLTLADSAEYLLTHCTASECVSHASYKLAIARGLAFFSKKQLDSMFFQMNKAIHWAKKSNNPDFEFMAYKYLGYIYAELKDTISSQRYHAKAYELAEKASKNDPVFCYLISNDGMNTRYRNESLPTSALKVNEEENPSYLRKAKVLMSQGHPRLTMAYVNKLSETGGAIAISDEDRILLAREFSTKYELAEKDAAIRMTQDLLQKQKKTHRKLTIGILLSLAGCIGLWLLYSHNIYKLLRNIKPLLLRKKRPTPPKPSDMPITPIATPISKPLSPATEETDSASNEEIRNDAPDHDEASSISIHPVINRLMNYMEADKLYLDPQLSLEYLAQKMDISRSYLSEIINKSLQKSFTDFVNYYRVEYAKDLLINTKDKIDVICRECGFGSRQTFYIVFKKSENLTPAEFRKKYEDV